MLPSRLQYVEIFQRALQSGLSQACISKCIAKWKTDSCSIDVLGRKDKGRERQRERESLYMRGKFSGRNFRISKFFLRLFYGIEGDVLETWLIMCEYFGRKVAHGSEMLIELIYETIHKI